MAQIEKQGRILREDLIKKRNGKGEKREKKEKGEKLKKGKKRGKISLFVSLFMNIYHVWGRGWGWVRRKKWEWEWEVERKEGE